MITSVMNLRHNYKYKLNKIHLKHQESNFHHLPIIYLQCYLSLWHLAAIWYCTIITTTIIVIITVCWTWDCYAIKIIQLVFKLLLHFLFPSAWKLNDSEQQIRYTKAPWQQNLVLCWHQICTNVCTNLFVLNVRKFILQLF